MDCLVQLDSLQVTVIVDNETDGLSPPCACCDPSSSAAAADRAAKYTSEISHLASEVKGGGADCLDFSSICFAGHGYSLLLEAEADGRFHRCVQRQQVPVYVQYTSLVRDQAHGHEAVYSSSCLPAAPVLQPCEGRVAALQAWV